MQKQKLQDCMAYNTPNLGAKIIRNIRNLIYQCHYFPYSIDTYASSC